MAVDDTGVRDQLVEAFLAADGPISGEELSHRLGLSRTAVWKQVKALEQVGFEFEASPRVGYRAIRIPDELMAPLVRPHLPPECLLGSPILWAASRASTNDTALELAAKGLPHGGVVTAGEQTGGRGRRDRAWASPRGGMWFTVFVRNPCALRHAPDLTLLAALGVCRALRVEGVPAQIKWPNDLLLNGKKIGGILAQIRAEGELVDHAVIGIGLNANFSIEALPADIRHRATTILHEMGTPIHRAKVLARILTQLDALYRDLQDGRGFQAVHAEWTALCSTVGQEVEVAMGEERLRGIARSIEPDGSLVLETSPGVTRTVVSGEVLFSAREQV
ncbi:biotin--[acetyl-CoA-carboxylase] ligase [Alicyclobacillus mali]|uniref:Bifunctional ligase/repressor BirA n=1 Tax=Alicyclobacillus mali (ex Roth et al. 2021) TaxID=1123961 RepID=A0ABS0F2C2_9BACL|nr:biotin--[acetyl-CoA-carboxylase] ligase [Alicyclobacillus mali (ex Roth et al. 2021)]MBF8377449.1 biotin--[acetyl-CoA-carboxylase] ligase [Alicyclobacillus mali (ex Roth et al. 2021)]MCL6487417.1 biotin--[acetyl-CoA-carboxylase] ligase [Alicyclobacillus mali (ex Roth et al. 2021)]